MDQDFMNSQNPHYKPMELNSGDINHDDEMECDEGSEYETCDYLDESIFEFDPQGEINNNLLTQDLDYYFIIKSNDDKDCCDNYVKDCDDSDYSDYSDEYDLFDLDNFF